MTKKAILYLILGIILIFSVSTFLIVKTGFNPYDETTLNINNNQVKLSETDESITLLTYNIGYGGLDSGWDSYQYGGENSRARSESALKENLDFIVKSIDEVNPDIFLLQELDTDSKRSFNIDQLSFLNEKYPNYGYSYGMNKVIRYLPFPITSPTGKIESGIATFSKFNTLETTRYSLPNGEGFFDRLFEYNWAITKSIFETNVQGDLVVINVKLSAFNEGDFIRERQLEFLRRNIVDEYNRGNYVIVGGDFSHNLPGADPYSFRFTEEWPAWLKNIPDIFQVNNFSWYIDDSTPTFRSLVDTYNKGESFVAVTDGFLISDNILVEEVVTLNYDFQHSNHNPVTIRLKLIPWNCSHIWR